jgi:transposase
VRDEWGVLVLRRQVTPRWEAVGLFLRDRLVGPRAAGGYVAIVEVCGMNDWLVKLLPEYGCREAIVVQPEERSRHKTDRRDANTLSEVLWVNRQRLLSGQKVQGLRRIQLPDAEDQQDRRLTALRMKCGRELTRTINRVRAILRRHNLEQECPTKGIRTQAAREWLAGLSLSPVERQELDHLRKRWRLFAQQQAQLERQIRERQHRSVAAAILATLPGGGAFTSLALACRVSDVRRFRRPRSLANYWGLTPGTRNSGDATQRLGSITKQGSRIARFLLGQQVLHLLRKDGGMRHWYRRIKHRRGSKIARVAVMRRLATIVWHMLTKQEAYQYGGPPRRKLRRAAAGAVP